jgi:hypothetical protein
MDDSGAEDRRPRPSDAAAAARPRTKPPLTGRLLKPVDLSEAKPRDVRAQLDLAPDESDVLAYAEDEFGARAAELNEFLSLPRDARDPEQTAKALIEREFGIPRDAQNWWPRLAACLIRKTVPGFSFIKANKKKHGAPVEWTPERLMQLFADVEFFKRKGLRVTAICRFLPIRAGYKQRWAAWHNHEGALRRAYCKANELRQKDFLFLLELCGGDALIPGKCGDLIAKAIERHALQI